MALRLYELADEYKQLLDNLYDCETGEINATVANRLNELDKPLEDKCINSVRALKSLKYERRAIEEERKAMQKREKAINDEIDWLENYLVINMQKSSISEITCPQFVIRLKKNRFSTDIYDKEAIPDEYVKVAFTHNVQQILDDLKAGKKVPGARLQQKNSIQIT